MNKFFLVLLTAVSLFACQTDDFMYSEYDVYYKNAFQTSNGSVLESAAFVDSVAYISDDEISIKGSFEYAADDIIKYGHCWVEGNNIPVINKDSSNCTFFDDFVYSGDSYYSKIKNLKFENNYCIRSFIVTRSGKVGYNPSVTKVKTGIPHDKWNFAGAMSLAARADGVSIITVNDNNDTVTYFGLGRNASACFSDFFKFDNSHKVAEQLSNVRGRGSLIALWGAVGFYLNYVDDAKQKLTKIYVGCGCSTASDCTNENCSRNFYVYDIESNKWGDVYYDMEGVKNTADNMYPFMGQFRVGAVGFSIDKYGFVGLGKTVRNEYHSDFYVWKPRQDENGKVDPTRGYFEPQDAYFPAPGRSGSSVVIVDNVAYIIGGEMKDGYSDDVYQCRFTLPNQAAKDDVFKFAWKLIKKFPDGMDARAYGSAFAIGDYIFYGTGENYDGVKADMFKYDLTNNRIMMVSDYKNGLEEADPLDENILIAPGISRAFCINAGDRAYLGCGYFGDGDKSRNVDYVSKYTNALWCYRP